ncbi:MAG: hypothetical protein H0V47_08785 [Chloroflexia bacterium]|nr:hypothetical protein [Chloroflexia bacterium]
MRDSQRMGDRGPRPQARPFGSSGLAAMLAIGVFFVALVVAGVLVLGDDDDSGEFALSDATATATTGDVGNALVTTTPTSLSDPGVSPTLTTGVPAVTPRTFPTLTPAPTSTPDPAIDEPTSIPDPENVEPTATANNAPDDDATLEPEDDPAEPVEEAPPPVEEPLTGEFGFLPPPQLPSGGTGQSLTLNYQLGTSLELVPTTGTVYLAEWPSYTTDEVATMAANLGIDGDVVEQGAGVFSVSDDDSSLFVSSTIIEYGAASAGGEDTVPSADVAVDAAWSWFSATGIGGIAAGSAEVIAREEDSGLAVVALWPEYPVPNLAPTPGARIKVSAGGVVEEAHVEWPVNLVGSEYGMTPALDLWEALRNGQAFVSADLSESGPGSGTVTITDISIAYTVSGSPYDAQYIVPLVVFGGTATINGSSVYVSAYVPAVYHQGNPLG